MKQPNCISFIVPALALTSFVSCQQASSSFEEEMKTRTVRANDELLNKGNLSFADDIFTADYRGKGPAIIKEYVSQYRNAFPDLQVSVSPVIAEGNMTAWRRSLSGTFTNELEGIQPTGKKISWNDIVISRLTDDGKIAEEWGASDLGDVLQSENNNVEGVYEYLPPTKGQSINRNGHFVYFYGPSDGSSPMICDAGTYRIMGDTVICSISYTTQKGMAGTSFKYSVTSQSGDTLSYQVWNMAGEKIGNGRSVKVSH